MRQFTLDSLAAIRETQASAISRYARDSSAEKPGDAVARWHDLNSGQVFAVCSSMMRAALSDEEIIRHLHLILPSHITVGDVVDLYELDYAELDDLYYGDNE